MIIDIERDSCIGCSACVNACYNNAIIMKSDREGFLYPESNKSNCNNCNNCKNVCPVINGLSCNNRKTPKVYAAKSLNEKIVLESSSGGIFTELAKQVLSENGYVVGARYNNNLLVEHCAVKDIEKLSMLQKSKYTQSRIGMVYRDIKALLDAGKEIFFVGTPCQTAGIKGFLSEEYDNLLIADLVCHGVNSPRVYREYLNCIEKQYGSKVRSIDFRDKTNGWKHFAIKIIFENNAQYFNLHKQEIFYRGFMKNLFLRPSCYQCKYKGRNRISDITIADFWGVHLHNKDESEHNGISLVLIHNKKGNQFFEKVKDKLFFEEHTIEEAVAKNPCLIKPVNRNALREVFFKMYNEKTKGLDEIIGELLDRSIR